MRFDESTKNIFCLLFQPARLDVGPALSLAGSYGEIIEIVGCFIYVPSTASDEFLGNLRSVQTKNHSASSLTLALHALTLILQLLQDFVPTLF